MSTRSGAWPFYVAVALALTTDAGVAALLGGDRVYSLRAPIGATFDYVVLGGVTEDEFWTFVQGGSTLTMQVHLWVHGDDAERCAQLYGEVHRVLNRASLDLGPPFASRSTATMRLIDIMPDPADPFVHGVARLELVAVRS